MPLLDLTHTTLFCADCVNVARAVRVLEHCQKLCQFGDVKFLTSLPTDYPHETIRPLNSLNDYSAFLLKEAWKYVKTPYLLTVQHDGWILNPQAWDEAWLKYDYSGPLYLQERRVDARTVGSGGFSFRSTRLMAEVAALTPVWDGHNSYNRRDGKNNWGHEDGVITKHYRTALEGKGFAFAPPLEAGRFAYGGNLDMAFYHPEPFGFHGFYALDRLRGGAGAAITTVPSPEWRRSAVVT